MATQDEKLQQLQQLFNAQYEFDLAFAFKMKGLQGIAPDALRVVSFDYQAHISELFTLELKLAARIDDVANPNTKDIAFLDKPAELVILDRYQGKRSIHGIVTSAFLTGTGNNFHHYSITLHPPAFRLTLMEDCRIFQELTIPQIIQRIMQEKGIPQFELDLTATYPVRNFVVMFNETYWNFIQRWCVQEGIFHYIDNSVTDTCKHIFVDRNEKSMPIGGKKNIPFNSAMITDTPVGKGPYIGEFEWIKRLAPTRLEQRSYNPMMPNYNLAQVYEAKDRISSRDYHQFHFANNYRDNESGKRFTQFKLESERAASTFGKADCNLIYAACGDRFNLTEHPFYDDAYLITQVAFSGTQPQAEEEHAATGPTTFHCQMQVIKHTLPFRAKLGDNYFKPRSDGPHVARVVGPPGEEIYTNDMGDIKVLFPWDYRGKADEKASCWIPVATTSGNAGMKFGSIETPRIGQDAVVDFIDGDYDFPIVVAQTWNDLNQPPYPLPQDKSKSVLYKSQSFFSDPGLSNELTFDDSKDQEEIYIHAQRDHNTLVENDQSLEVRNNRRLDVNHDHTEHVGGDKTTRIENNQISETRGDAHYMWHKDRREEVKGTRHIQAGDEFILEAGQKISLKVGGQAITLDGSEVAIDGGAINIGLGASPSNPQTPLNLDPYPYQEPSLTALMAQEDGALSVENYDPSKHSLTNTVITNSLNEDAGEDQNSWIEIELVSEMDEPINGLTATVIAGGKTYTQAISNGKLFVPKLPAGPITLNIEKAKLFEVVENYPSRPEGEESQVKARASKEAGYQSIAKIYQQITIGDLADEPLTSDDLNDHLLERHGKGKGSHYQGGELMLKTNKSYVLEVTALRAFIPLIEPGTDYTISNGYNFGLLSSLAYANLDTEETKSNYIGSIQHVFAKFELLQQPDLVNTISADSPDYPFLVEEVPFSQRYKYEEIAFFNDPSTNAQMFVVNNPDNVIISVRGTEFTFDIDKAKAAISDPLCTRSEFAQGITNGAKLCFERLKTEYGKAFKIVLESPAWKDALISDAAGDQVQFEEGTYGFKFWKDDPNVHQGFYTYATSLIEIGADIGDSKNTDILQYIEYFSQNKACYICGHSLGGAGALILAVLLHEDVVSKQLSSMQLYTYGMPRTGTEAFVEKYNDIPHHRHVNQLDIVPQVPFQGMEGSYNEGAIGSSAGFLLGFSVTGSIAGTTVALSDWDWDNYLHHGNLVQLDEIPQEGPGLFLSHHHGVDQVNLGNFLAWPTPGRDFKDHKHDIFTLNNLLNIIDQGNQGTEFHRMTSYMPSIKAVLYNANQARQGLASSLKDKLLRDTNHQIKALQKQQEDLLESRDDLKLRISAGRDITKKLYESQLELTENRLKENYTLIKNIKNIEIRMINFPEPAQLLGKTFKQQKAYNTWLD